MSLTYFCCQHLPTSSLHLSVILPYLPPFFNSFQTLHMALISCSSQGYRSLLPRTHGQSSSSLLLVTFSSLGSVISPSPPSASLGIPSPSLLLMHPLLHDLHFSCIYPGFLVDFTHPYLLLLLPSKWKTTCDWLGQWTVSRRDKSLPSKAWHMTLQLSFLLLQLFEEILMLMCKTENQSSPIAESLCERQLS